MPSPPSCAPLCALLSPLVLLTAATAENEVLFIGNSFTIGGSSSVPEIFDLLATAGGHDDPTTVMRAVGGRDYEFHATDPASQAAIASRQWTHVILQNYSTEPTHVGNVADHFTYGENLYDQIMANNPATQIILFETWSRAANHPLITGSSTPSSFASTTEFQMELRDNYSGLADLLNSKHPDNPPVLTGPVGDAWERAGGLLSEADPSFTDLHGSDNYHGNDNGYFMAAAVFYSIIYGESAEGLHTDPAFGSLRLSLTESPTYLEQVVWDVVNPDAELVFTTQPLGQTVTENASVTLSAAVLGARPITLQWKENGEDITGATGSSYTIGDVSASQDGASFTVVASNGNTTITSAPAVLSVVPDTVAPEATSATAQGGSTVDISFSESLDPTLANDLNHYAAVSHGRRIAISSATLSEDGTRVTLELDGTLEGRFSIALYPSLTDRSGNGLAPDTVVVGGSPAASGQEFLIDFGSTGSPTGPGDGGDRFWNNVTNSVGGSPNSSLELFPASGEQGSGTRIEMVRAFNGANNSGTRGAEEYPPTASQDSLFGNTETFGGQSDVFPAFRLAGLSPDVPYSLVFYASRLSVGDNRETLYTATGATVSSTTLDPANNIGETAMLAGVLPDPQGQLLIELSPSPNNNNANHFTYLGALSVAADSGADDAPDFYRPVVLNGRYILDWTGNARLETSLLQGDPWTAVETDPAPPYPALMGGPARYFRLAK